MIRLMVSKRKTKKVSGWQRLMGVGVLSLATLGMAACGQKTICVDKSKPALEQCQTKAEGLRKQLNDIKVKLAQALANPGTIKVDPEILTLIGPEGKKRKIVLREGTLKQTEVIRVFRLGKVALQACYNHALKRNSSLRHSSLTLNVAFRVRASGSPASVSIRPNRDAKMTDCMKKAILRWEFARFSGQPVGVESPVTLRPKG